jgi:hypothetical protein
MAPNIADKQQSTGTLLKQDEREICTGLLAADNPHGQRAQALLAIDGGATQIEAGKISGLTKGGVRYWLGKFRENRLSIFPPELIDSQSNLQAINGAQDPEDLNIAESVSEKPAVVTIQGTPEETGTFPETVSEKREAEKREDKPEAQQRRQTKKKPKKKTKKKSKKKTPTKKKKGSKKGRKCVPSKKSKKSKGKKKGKEKSGKKKSKKKKGSKKNKEERKR